MINYILHKAQKKIINLFYYFLSYGANVHRANELVAEGKLLAASREFQRYLKRDPHNISALLALAYCYEQLGEKRLANAMNAHAYALDDTFTPAIFRRANSLVDLNRSAEALPLLALIKDDPLVAETVDSLLSGICMNRGDAYRAKEFQLSSWLADFDNLRNANCYLFRLAYNDSDEALLAQEHQFWGNTRKEFVQERIKTDDIISNKTVKDRQLSINETSSLPSKRIRIGYWGCDFREHSVRYFSRPLITSHNKEEFEVYIYNDNSLGLPTDKQTEFFRASVNKFHDVQLKTDEEAVALIKSHKLDILVDLAGHTSENRLHLFKLRLATLQITGLAYPPTTGLRSIDVKMMDKHIWTPDASRYYSESPMVLPRSLWCFDPMEEVPYSMQPPVLKNGYVTFGCFGNVAKITTPIIRCWKLILDELPTSRLVIQSPTFNDSDTLAAFQQRLSDAGIRVSQAELRGPTFGEAFWAAYKELDIILDTYPFNGGTTSSYAAYSGVPIVTLAGNSLISRVGRSIMLNLGYPDFVVGSFEDYVKCSIASARNIALLVQFRKSARETFKESSLGNGKKFAAEFELACKELLRQKTDGTFENTADIPALPADVLLNRAQTVWYHGNVVASSRIVSECLRHYPKCGGAYILQAKQLASERKLHEAIATIDRQIECFNAIETHDALLLLVRFHLLLGDNELARGVLDRLSKLSAGTSLHDMQAKLLNIAIQGFNPSLDAKQPIPPNVSILVLIPCSDIKVFEQIKSNMLLNCIQPTGWTIQYEYCQSDNRIVAYNEAMATGAADILVFMRHNLTVHNPYFFLEVANTLDTCDLLGCAGATRWIQKDWSLDHPDFKAWGIMRSATEAESFIELQLAGSTQQKVVQDAVVLDGKFLAFKSTLLSKVEFDEDLSDSLSLAEEDWSNRVYRAGHRVSVHRNLGLLIGESLVTHPMRTSQGQRNLINRLKLEPLSLSTRDFTAISVPLRSAIQGYEVAEKFLI